jgi:uncharacterized protein YecA (UPF0149 family)
MEEHSVPAEQSSLEAVSLVLHEIVDAVLEQEDSRRPAPVEEPGRRGDEGARETDEG